MKRIFKNHDISFNLEVNKFPINFNLIKKIDFKFYTTSPLVYFSKTEKDVNKQNTIILPSQDLDKLNEGVLYYDYQLVLIDSAMPDQTFDTCASVMSEFYLANGNHMDEPVDETKLMWGKISGDINDQIDLMKKFGKYYDKTQVDGKFDEVINGDVELKNYYTKQEIEDKKYLQANDIAGKLDKTEYENDKKNYLTIIDAEKGYVTKSELAGKNYLTEHQSLDHMLSKAEAQQTYVSEESLSDRGFLLPIDLVNYATKGDIPTKISQLYNDKNYVDILQLKNYFTKEETLDVLDEHLMGVDAPKLSNYYRKEETYNRDEVDAAIKKGAANIDLTVFYTKSQIDGKGFLTEHQSLNHMLSKVEATQTYQPLGDYVTNKMLDARGFLLPVDLVDYARLGDIPTLTSQLKNDSGFLNTNSLLEYAKKIWVSDEIDRRLKDVRVDLSDYYTRAEIDSFNFATQTWAQNTITSSLKNYFTRDEIEAFNFATKSWVQNEIKNTVVLENYYTKDEINGFNFATQTWTQTTITDTLKDYYTKLDIDGQTEVMKSWVQNEIKNTADLTNYYTKNEIDRKIGGIDELLDYLNGEVI